jgi:hypothetical protein
MSSFVVGVVNAALSDLLKRLTNKSSNVETPGKYSRHVVLIGKERI